MRYGTRKLAAFFTLASLVALLGACQQGNPNAVATAAGTSVDLAGQDWLVVNYWAEWCGPCRHEIPELNALDATVLSPGDSTEPAIKPGATIAVVGVNYDGVVDQKLIDVSQRMGIEFAVLASDPRERWEQPNPSVLPSTYLIAPGGEYIETLVGPQTRAGIISRIETLDAQR